MGMESDSCVVRLASREMWCVKCEGFMATVTPMKMLSRQGVTDYGDLTECSGCGLILLTPAKDLA